MKSLKCSTSDDLEAYYRKMSGITAPFLLLRHLNKTKLFQHNSPEKKDSQHGWAKPKTIVALALLAIVATRLRKCHC